MSSSSNPAPQSRFAAEYKKMRRCDQEKRRRWFLEEQRRKRNHAVDSARGVLLAIKEECKYFRSHQPRCKYKLMFSEWMLEVPPDLDVSWLMRLCPTGKRNIVIATKGMTKVYAKDGRFLMKFSSLFPGGCAWHEHDSNSNQKSGHCTILDCIYSEETDSFYILDMISWGSQPFIECETEFRFHWIKAKMDEIDGLSFRSSANHRPFFALPFFRCDRDSMQEAISNFPLWPENLPALDGLLFYHSEAHYHTGRTPLVSWLKPFMLPEILNVAVPLPYMMEKPENYIDLQHHVETAEEKKKNRKRKKAENMGDVEMCQ